MKWYTLKWEDNFEGCIVEHFATKELAERRELEVKEVSTYSQTYSINEHEIHNKGELIEWLNHHYTHENG